MTQSQLSGRIALVTGAAHRLGRAICLALADQGVHIVAHYSTSDADMPDLRAELDRRGVKSWTLRADFARPSDTESLIARSLKAAGGLDFLVNNASIFRPSTLQTMDFAGLVEHLQINAWTPLVLGREFARSVDAGKIVNILDSRITDYDRQHITYILSKQALASLTRIMAIEFAPNVTVNGIAPGLILPPPGKDEAYLQLMADTVPLMRHGNPGDITDGVLYLLQSDFMTGQVLFVDGGRHLKEYPNGSHTDP